MAHVVLLKELFRVVVAIDVDLSDDIEDGRVLTACLNASLKPR